MLLGKWAEYFSIKQTNNERDYKSYKSFTFSTLRSPDTAPVVYTQVYNIRQIETLAILFRCWMNHKNCNLNVNCEVKKNMVILVDELAEF